MNSICKNDNDYLTQSEISTNNYNSNIKDIKNNNPNFKI